MTIVNHKSQIVNRSALLPEELAILEPPPTPSMAEWLTENLYLPKKESRIDGRFSFEWSPWMRGLCDWYCDPAVREITLLGPLQFGKTLFLSACLAYSIRWTPMPTMVVMANHQSLNKRMKRLRAMFEANEFLMDQIDGDIKNLNVGEATELTDLLLVLAWVTSDAALAESPEGIILADEVALWDRTVQNSDLKPTDHLRGRQETYDPVRKLIKVSSARETGDLADEEYEAGDRCEFWVPCHKCSYWHFPRWYDKDQPGVYAVIDKEKDGSWLSLKEYASADHVHYHCPSCGTVWSDYARAANLQKGVWLPQGVTMGLAGKMAGVIEPSAYKSARVRCLTVHPKLRSIRKMSVDWVRGQVMLQTGQIAGLKHFLNNQEAQPWRDEKATTDDSKLRQHVGGYVSLTVPDSKAPWGVQVIVIAVDVHEDWFRVVVHGYGYLFESWLLSAFRVETSDTKEQAAYEPLKGWIARTWPLADGAFLPPAAVVIDRGYQTEPVTTFCRANRHVVHNGNLLPISGSPRRMNQMYKKFAVDATLSHYELNPLILKDQLYRMLFAAQDPGPGYMHLPKDLGGDAFGELCSEHKITVKGFPVWIPKKDGRDNHAWDASYYNLFASHLVGVGGLRPLPQEPPPASPRLSPKQTHDEARGGGFLDGLPDLR
jgi:phage terminase large subunit GpA-like protein